MKLTFKKSMMLLLAACFISLSSVVLAQGKKGKDKEEKKEVIIEKKISHDEENYHSNEGGMGIKGLTEDQKQKIDKMKTPHQKEMMQIKNLIGEKKAHLKTLETADNADLNAINKTIEEMGVLKTDMMKKKAAHKQEIRKILNDEQRLQFDLKHSREGKGDMKNKKMRKMRKGGRGMEMEKDIDIKIIQEDDNK